MAMLTPRGEAVLDVLVACEDARAAVSKPLLAAERSAHRNNFAKALADIKKAKADFAKAIAEAERAGKASVAWMKQFEKTRGKAKKTMRA